MATRNQHKTGVWAGRTLYKTILMLVLPLPAFAALGASVDSVQHDQARMQAKITIAANPAYTVHELTSPLGVVVREYASPSGSIFAVSWRGHFMPDLRQLLGTYFEQYAMAARGQRERQAGRSFLMVREPSLVVQSVGHLREYSGRAYDPTLIPSGVSADDLQ